MEEQVSKSKYCVVCGSIIPEGSVVCPNCHAIVASSGNSQSSNVYTENQMYNYNNPQNVNIPPINQENQYQMPVNTYTQTFGNYTATRMSAPSQHKKIRAR